MGAFFFRRINDHVQYLGRLEKTLKKEGDFQGTDCHDCQLGKWLYGTGRDEVAGLGDQAIETFDSLFAPHQSFHEAGARALEALKAERNDDVKMEVTQMLKLSNTLISRLMDLDRVCKK